MSLIPDSSDVRNMIAGADPVPTAGADVAAELGNLLSNRQLAALAAITSGKNLTHAAEAGGVTRRTVYNWLATDPHFRAAYNLWKKELMELGRGRLIKLTETAIDAAGGRRKRRRPPGPHPAQNHRHARPRNPGPDRPRPGQSPDDAGPPSRPH